ncbi:c-type cytochrome [Hyphomicrobium facile]|uniref:Cytochrome c n=1 Tax=Hyphomicrobium facile TaxID=51670 RepID=A0A1I7N2S7_9HYPH|nr:c-type cytochrome [Hyphomicrobium facile]SFV28967.1 cytochrome c [Hyphomicrobium facile]
MRILLIGLGVLSFAFAPAAFAADSDIAIDATGAEVFNNNCRTCHSWKKDDNRLGPSLHGVVGRKAGSVEGFNYSPAMKEANVTWDEGTVDKFIANPESVVPNNSMKPFTGISDIKTRKDIVDFLKSNPD